MPNTVTHIICNGADLYGAKRRWDIGNYVYPSDKDIVQYESVASDLTLNAKNVKNIYYADAELILDIASGATVTAGYNITFVDTLESNKRNICVVRWSNGSAKLYVVDTYTI